MRRLLHALLKRRRARGAGVVCYLRENGPIAYELDLFASAPRARADAMHESPLWWAWRAGHRDWTELTRVSLSAFLADVAAGDLLLLGTAGDVPADLANATVAAWLRAFSRVQPSPVLAVIAVAGERQLLFVQQHAPDAVNALLDAWGLDKGSAQRRAYARLGPASIESVVERLR